MTLDEKKTWLKRYRVLWIEIDRLQDELERWQSLAEKVTSPLSDMPKGGGVGGIENAVVKITDLKAEIDIKIDKAIAMRKEIENVLYSLPDDILKEIMLLRYIGGDTWEVIGEKMNYTERWAKALHKKALTKVKIKSSF